MSDKQRLFFALWPDDALRAALTPLRKLKDECGGRPHPPANFHLTLNFLGMLDADSRNCLEQSVSDILIPPFELILDHFGYWPRPKVVWIGCREIPQPLIQLVGEIGEVMASCGLQPEGHPYRPHLTLLRKAKQAPTESAPEFHWKVCDFVLAESVSTPAGVEYRVLRRWPLSAK